MEADNMNYNIVQDITILAMCRDVWVYKPLLQLYIIRESQNGSLVRFTFMSEVGTLFTIDSRSPYTVYTKSLAQLRAI